MTPEHLAIIKASLDRRQTDLTVVMENIRKPHNLAAVARILEAVGGLEIHAITDLTSIRLTQMSAGGTKKWIKVSKHPSTDQGLNYLKQQGFQIIATRAPLIKSIMFLPYRLACDQGIILKACRNLVKNNNAEHE